MRKVKILCGAYGCKAGPGKPVKPVRMGGTVELPEKEAARLVGLRVAAYADAGPTESVAPAREGLPVYSADMRAEELRELLSAVGLNHAGKTKAEMVAALDDHYADAPFPDEEAPVV